MTAAMTPWLDGIGAQRRSHGALFQIADAGRKRAGAQHHGEVLGLLRGESAGDAAFIVNLLLDGGNFLDLVVEHHGQLLADVGAGEAGEAAPAFAGQQKADGGTAVLVGGGLGGAQVAPGNGRGAGDDVPGGLGGVATARADGAALHQHRIRRQHAILRGQRFLLAGKRAGQRLPDFQQGGGLHDLLDAGGIVHARQLDQDLVLAEAVLLDDRLADAKLVNAVANGLDGLRHGTVLELGERLRLHGQRPGVLGAGGEVVLRQQVADDLAQVGGGLRRNTLDLDAVGIACGSGLVMSE